MSVKEERLKKLAIVFLFLFTFSGVISLMSVKLNLSVLRVWKEGLVILLFLIGLGNVFFGSKIQLKKVIVFVLLFIPFFILYILFSIDTNRLLVFYQIKSDLVPLLFVFAVYFIIDNKDNGKDFYYKIIKTIIITSIINSFAVYFESIFPSIFMAALDIEDFNNSGGASGVRLDNALGGLRAMGTMTSFINSGTLIFFGIVCLLESKIYKRLVKLVVFAILVSAMLLTTYKSTMIALFLYLIVKSIYSVVKRVNGAKFIYFIAAIIVFTLLAYCFNNMSVYNSLATTKYKILAYNSIYLRVAQHANITNQMESQDSFATGLGLGVNGTSGPDKKLKLTSKPLDSTYIYLMSNYGFIGTCLYVFILFSLLFYLCSYGRYADNIAVVMVFYTASVEFFINNIFANFPNNIIFYTVVFLSIYLRKSLMERDVNK